VLFAFFLVGALLAAPALWVAALAATKIRRRAARSSLPKAPFLSGAQRLPCFRRPPVPSGAEGTR